MFLLGIVMTSALAMVCIYWLVFWLFQRRWLFPAHRVEFEKENKPKNGQSVWLSHSFGQTEIWWLPAETRSKRCPAVIVAHGQMGIIDSWEDRLSGLRERGFHCVLVEFPGYGRSQGRPSQTSIEKVLVAAYDWLVGRDDVDREQIIGLGRSMGGGVITLLARQRRLVNVWLMSTFTSLKPFVRKKGVPGWVLRDALDNLTVLSHLDVPILIIHGTDDDIIPVQHSRQLANVAKYAHLVLEKADHQTCPLNWDAFCHLATEFYFQTLEGTDLADNDVK